MIHDSASSDEVDRQRSISAKTLMTMYATISNMTPANIAALLAAVYQRRISPSNLAP
jgi:hypothetical protein